MQVHTRIFGQYVYGVVLCGARSWTWWSLRVPSNLGYAMMLWNLLSVWAMRHLSFQMVISYGIWNKRMWLLLDKWRRTYWDSSDSVFITGSLSAPDYYCYDQIINCHKFTWQLQSIWFSTFHVSEKWSWRRNTVLLNFLNYYYFFYER